MDMTSETLVVLCWELHGHRMAQNQIAQRLGKHHETIHLWFRGIQELGLLGFLDKNRLAKKGEPKRRQVDPIVKRYVWEIKDREFDCCGQKIQYFLEWERKVHLSIRKFYEIPAEKYIIPKLQKNK